MNMNRQIIVAAIITLIAVASVSAQPSQREGRHQAVTYLKADTASTFPFSDAVRVGNMLYLSGSVGLDASGKIVPGGISAETKQVMENIRQVLERNGSSLDRVVKCTVVLADIAEWPAMNAVYRTYFRKDRLPARTAFASTGLALGARVEIECWATVE